MEIQNSSCSFRVPLAFLRIESGDEGEDSDSNEDNRKHFTFGKALCNDFAHEIFRLFLYYLVLLPHYAHGEMELQRAYRKFYKSYNKYMTEPENCFIVS